MGDQNERRSRRRVQFEQQLADVATCNRIQVPRGLIGEQYGWLCDECSREGHSLLLATGELPRIVAGTIAQPNALQRVTRGATRIRARSELEGQHHVFQRSQGRNQVERLKDESDALCTQAGAAIFVQLCNIRPGQPDLAGCRRIQACKERE